MSAPSFDDADVPMAVSHHAEPPPAATAGARKRKSPHKQTMRDERKAQDEGDMNDGPTAAAAASSAGGRPQRAAVNYAEQAPDDEQEEATSDAADEARPAKKKKTTTPVKKSKAAAPSDESATEDEAVETSPAPAAKKCKSKATTPAAAASSTSKKRRTAAAAAAAATLDDEHERELGADEAFFDGAAAAAAAEGDQDGMSPAEARAFLRDPFDERKTAAGSAYLPVDPTRVADAGILTKLHLKNFMNFDNFAITFNPNVNFIHGMNGAGKSSILHAIQLVFGAKAADTSRGRNIAKLIKDGRDTAEITVFIKNHAGPMSYKHEVYGEEIELTRKFKRNGKDGATATYLMQGRGEDGRVNSSKASSDVRAMCDAFNIQVANPCVVMTQEVAAKFLQTHRPEDKYAFFFEATQLESLREKLHDAKGRIDEMKTTLKVQQEKIPDLEKRIAHLMHQEKLAEEAEQMERDITDLQHRMVWRKVKDQEIEYDRCDAERQALVARVGTMQTKVDALTAAQQTESDFKRDVDAHKQKLMEYTTKADDLQRERAERTAAIEKVQHEQRHQLSRIQQTRDKIKELETKKAAAEKKIAEIAERNSRDTSHVDGKRTKERAQLEAEKLDLQKEKQQTLDQANALAEASVRLKVEESEMHRIATEKNSRLMRLANELSSLEREAGSATNGPQYNIAFGAYTRAIRAAIQQVQQARDLTGKKLKDRFKVQPIGPLGEYVQVNTADEQWLPAITECLCRRNMSTYVVDSFDDQLVLKEVLEKVWRKLFGPPPPKPEGSAQAARDPRPRKPDVLILPKRPRYQVTPPTVPFGLIYECLDIKDDWAFNAVVLVCKPERYGLHRDADKAIDQLRPLRAATLQDQPENSDGYVTGSFLAEGTRIRIMGQSRDGSVMVEAPSGKPMFKVNRADQIAKLHQEHQAHQAMLDDYKKLVQAKANEIRSNTAASDPLVRRNREIDGKIRRLEEAIDDVDYQMERAAKEIEKVDDSRYVEAAERYTNEADELREHIRTLEAEGSADARKRIETFKEEIEAIDHQIEQVGVGLQEENAWLQNAIQQRAALSAKLKKYTDGLAAAQVDLNKCEWKFLQVSEHLAVAEAQASAVCPERVDSEEAYEKLAARHQAKLLLLQDKHRRQAIDLNEVRADLKATQLEKVTTEVHMSDVVTNLDQLQRMCAIRVQRMQKCRRSLANSASSAFSQTLLSQGASGSLHFDHDQETLTMVVHPTTADAVRPHAASTAALSGGERSIATIAFAMAVGEQVECPFRAMDEFDVFMDSVNRRTSMNLLMAIARNRKDRQFFFLSPQSVEGLTPGSYLTVQRLQPPQRSQQTNIEDYMERVETPDESEDQADSEEEGERQR